jgi:hypothetical protein
MAPLLATSEATSLLAVSRRSIRLWAECGANPLLTNTLNKTSIVPLFDPTVRFANLLNLYNKGD